MDWKHASDAELWQLFRGIATLSDDRFWNVTKLCSLFGRRFEDYKAERDVEGLIEVVAKERQQDASEFHVETDDGVFSDKQIATSVLLWCSPRLNEIVLGLVDDLLLKGLPGMPREHVEASLEQECPEAFQLLVEPHLGRGEP